MSDTKVQVDDQVKVTVEGVVTSVYHYQNGRVELELDDYTVMTVNPEDIEVVPEPLEVGDLIRWNTSDSSRYVILPGDKLLSLWGGTIYELHELSTLQGYLESDVIKVVTKGFLVFDGVNA